MRNSSAHFPSMYDASRAGRLNRATRGDLTDLEHHHDRTYDGDQSDVSHVVTGKRKRPTSFHEEEKRPPRPRLACPQCDKTFS